MSEDRAATGAALTVEGLSAYRVSDRAAIVRDIGFELAPGNILGVVGESGSGKTTLALALLGFAAPGLAVEAAKISFGDAVLDLSSADSISKARRRLVSYVPQDPSASLNPALSIKTQLYERLEGNKRDSAAVVTEVMTSVELPSDERFLKRKAGTLSGGQQQRVAIAMAAVTKPRVLVLDEPTTGLDVSTQSAVLALVRRLCHETGMCGVFISHDLAVVHHVADQILVLYAGRDEEYGPARSVTTAPAHPYTEALLRCVPDTARATELLGIPGLPPALEAPEPGCPFAPRCEYTLPACSEAVPDLQPTADGGAVRCVRYGEIDLRGNRSHARAHAGGAGERYDDGDAGTASLLEVSGLDAWYGESQVLFGVDLRVERGECVAVVGQSGSGKTTLSRCLIGLHPSYRGSIVFDGAPVAVKASKRSRDDRRQIQCIFQNPYGSLNPRLTVGASVRAPLSLYFGMRKSEARGEVEEALGRVGLAAAIADRYPDQLSGGQQQRVAIARALAARPDLLLCDEITSSLDVSVQASLINVLRDLIDGGVSMIFVTHDLGVVRNLADRVYVLKDGRVVEEGPTSRVIDDPQHEYAVSLLNDTLSVTGDRRHVAATATVSAPAMPSERQANERSEG